jgi:hypothetical protein
MVLLLKELLNKFNSLKIINRNATIILKKKKKCPKPYIVSFFVWVVINVDKHLKKKKKN